MLVLLLVLTITAPVTVYADTVGTGPLQYEVTNRNEIHINLQNLTDETMRSLDIELKLEAAAGSAKDIKFDYSNQDVYKRQEYGCTSSELTMEQKNECSHRGKALRQMKEKLKDLLK